jgi:hypothetical protein
MTIQDYTQFFGKAFEGMTPPPGIRSSVERFIRLTDGEYTYICFRFFEGEYYAQICTIRDYLLLPDPSFTGS